MIKFILKCTFSWTITEHGSFLVHEVTSGTSVYTVFNFIDGKCEFWGGVAWANRWKAPPPAHETHRHIEFKCSKEEAFELCPVKCHVGISKPECRNVRFPPPKVEQRQKTNNNNNKNQSECIMHPFLWKNLVFGSSQTKLDCSQSSPLFFFFLEDAGHPCLWFDTGESKPKTEAVFFFMILFGRTLTTHYKLSGGFFRADLKRLIFLWFRDNSFQRDFHTVSGNISCLHFLFIGPKMPKLRLWENQPYSFSSPISVYVCTTATYRTGV